MKFLDGINTSEINEKNKENYPFQPNVDRKKCNILNKENSTIVEVKFAFDFFPFNAHPIKW